MEFRTVYTPYDRQRGLISHDRPILLLGSCFSDNVGSRLVRDGFDATVNPVGTLYNPASITRALRSTGLKPSEIEAGMFQHEGVWHHPMFHSSFSSKDQGAALAKMRLGLDKLRRQLQATPVVVLTFGTAWVYYDQEGSLVTNCHKLPPSRFTRRLLTLPQTIGHIHDAIAALPPKSDVILTLSPIRHLADGFEGNSLSKSLLRVAIHEVMEQFKGKVSYFPAFEILNDDLRDYRFYAADMKHPSETAVDYEYGLFCSTYCTPATIERARASRKLWQRSQHRPLLQ